MLINVVMCYKNNILSKTIEVPTINVGWEIQVKFDKLPKDIYVTVQKITIYTYEDEFTKTVKQIIGDSPKIICFVKPTKPRSFLQKIVNSIYN